jgi:hypothetical protein
MSIWLYDDGRTVPSMMAELSYLARSINSRFLKKHGEENSLTNKTTPPRGNSLLLRDFFSVPPVGGGANMLDFSWMGREYGRERW